MVLNSITHRWINFRSRPVYVLGTEDGHGLEGVDQTVQVQIDSLILDVGLDVALEDDGVQHLDVFQSFKLKK